MSQIYLGDKIIASTEGSDIKYDENISVNEKINELESTVSNMLISEISVRCNEAVGYVQLYYNGQWNNWLQLDTTEDEVNNQYLYYKGTNYTDITGGWSGYTYVNKSTGSTDLRAPSVTMGDSYMTCKITYGGNIAGSVWNGYSIDLTDYNYIEINYTTTLGTSGANATFGCVATKANKFSFDASTPIKSTSNTTATLDISALTGNYYLCLLLYYSQVKVYSIKLIK